MAGGRLHEDEIESSLGSFDQDLQGEGRRDADRHYREAATAFAEPGQVEPARRRAARDQTSS